MSDGASSFGRRPNSSSASQTGVSTSTPVNPNAPFTPEFGEIEITSNESHEFQQLAKRLVTETIAEYTAFVDTQHRHMDNKNWKSVKSKDNFNVYRDRRNAVDRAYASKSSVIRPDDFTMPPLLGVGSIVGAVEDVMYGLATYSMTDMQWKSAQQQGEEMNGQLLTELQAPSLDDPFRFLGIRWSLMGHNSMTSVVLHDLIILVGTGMELTADGSYIGYQLTHSIELPECPEFGENNILRSKISCCSLFHQQPHGNVEVYTKTYIEPSPNVPFSFALAQTVSSMVEVVKTVEAGKDRKLARMLRDAKQRMAEGTEKPVLAKDASGNNCCGLCRKSFHMYNTIVTCQLCFSMVCSRCHVSRQVRLSDEEGNLVKKKVALCKNCVATIAKADASKIATKDFAGRAQGKRRQSSEARHSLTEKVMAQYLDSGTQSSSNLLHSTSSTSSDPMHMMSSGTSSLDGTAGNLNALMPYGAPSANGNYNTSVGSYTSIGSANGYAPNSYADPTMGLEPVSDDRVYTMYPPVQPPMPVEEIDGVDETYELPASFDVKLPRQQYQQPQPSQQYQPQQHQQPRLQPPAQRYAGSTGSYSSASSTSYAPNAGLVYDAPPPQQAYGNVRPTNHMQPAPMHATNASFTAYAPPPAAAASRDQYNAARGYPPNLQSTAPMAARQPANGGAYLVPPEYSNDYAAPVQAPYPTSRRAPQQQPMHQPMQQPRAMPAMAPPPQAKPQAPVNPQEEIWQRMNQLRLAAEEAYNMARENGDAMQMGTQRFGGVVQE